MHVTVAILLVRLGGYDAVKRRTVVFRSQTEPEPWYDGRSWQGLLAATGSEGYARERIIP
jgi:hypothetical protein